MAEPHYSESRNNPGRIGTSDCEFRESPPGCGVCYCNHQDKGDCKHRGVNLPYNSSLTGWSRKSICNLRDSS